MRRYLLHWLISNGLYPSGTFVQYEDFTTAKYEDNTDITHE